MARQSIVLAGMGWGRGDGLGRPRGAPGTPLPSLLPSEGSSDVPPGKGFLNQEPIAQKRPRVGGKTEGIWWSWNLFRMTPT